MWQNESEKPRGYEYPKPTSEIGHAHQIVPGAPIIKLSRDSIRKIRDSARKHGLLNEEKALAAKNCG